VESSPGVEDPGYQGIRIQAPRRRCRTIRNQRNLNTQQRSGTTLEVPDSFMASTYHSLNFHVVFATKGRTPIIEPTWRNDLHAFIGGAVRTLGAKPIAVGGVADHIHLLASLKATHCVADIVREAKKVSSAWATERYPRFAWQAGYAAFTVGQRDLSAVGEYIARQEEHHRRVSSSDELRSLLEEFGITYDERFFE